MARQVITLVSLVAWTGACSQALRETHASESEPAPVRVRVVEVGTVRWPSTYEATGTVRARTTATISARLMGAVHEVKVQIGDPVKEGQVLVVLDSRDLDAGLRRADAAREEIKGAIPEADSGVSGTKASLDLAQVTFNRMQDLYNKKSISNQEFDEISSRLRSAQAAYDIARAKRAQLDAKLAQAEQEVLAAEVNRDYAQIAAPFPGVVASKQVEPGNMALPGASLLTIEREGGFRLEVSVEESRLGSVRIGQSVPVRIEAVTVTGTVSEIVPEIDSASRAGIVKIDLPAIAALKSGAFGRALFASGSRTSLAVPVVSVIERGQLESVVVVENGLARTRLITLGAKAGNRVEVLSGLNGGEKVIVSAPQSVVDGTPVEALP